MEEVEQKEIVKIIPDEIMLSPDEKPIYFTRKHWVIFRNPFIFAFFFPFTFIMVSWMLTSPKLNSVDINLLGLIHISSIIFYLAIPSFVYGTFLFLWNYFIWSKTYYIVTTNRIIIVDQQNIFSHQIHQTTLDKVQEVLSSVNGIQAFLYGYGDLEIKISISTTNSLLVFKMIGKPREAQRIIMKLLAQRTSV